jgi:hypothetical protein
MPKRLTETLRAASEPTWSQAVGHRFVKELFAGAVPDAVMARYLIQDHRFLDSFLTLLGAALASADTFEARLRFGRFIGTVSSKRDFQLTHPCPSTGRTSGTCPGYVKDHVRALSCGGPDAVSNMQWQTKADAKAKDKWETKGCVR